MSDRPFKILGLQQIAVGGLDKAALRKFWIDTLGLTATGTYRSENENVDEDIAVTGAGAFKVEVDLMQPIDPDKQTTIRVQNVQIEHGPVGIAAAHSRANNGWMTILEPRNRAKRARHEKPGFLCLPRADGRRDLKHRVQQIGTPRQRVIRRMFVPQSGLGRFAIGAHAVDCLKALAVADPSVRGHATHVFARYHILVATRAGQSGARVGLCPQDPAFDKTAFRIVQLEAVFGPIQFQCQAQITRTSGFDRAMPHKVAQPVWA